MNTSSSMIGRHTPLDQLRQRDAVAMSPSATRLSDAEQARLKSVLRDQPDYVDHDLFHEPDAEAQVFDHAPEIPQPNTSWYHPLMENLASPSDANAVVNVVLTAEQEKALFLQFNYARFRVARIRERLGDAPLSDEQARDLLRWHDQAMRLRDHIAQTNLALVLAMAKRVRLSEMDFADLISEGNMALLRAIDKFNVARGFKFSTYACRAILKAFSRSGMKHSQYRQMFPTDFDPALERSDHMRQKFDEHEGDCAEEVKRIVLDNQASLSEVEQAVIHHRFALTEAEAEAADAQPLTLEQVGRIVGLTKERVRQIQNQALNKIRETLEDDYLDDR